MRVSSLLIVAAAACGNVKPPEPASMPDAGPDAVPMDAPAGPCQPMATDRFPPPWVVQGPFQPAVDPAGGATMVWKADGKLPAAASFVVLFHDGDRLTGLAFDAYGNGSDLGLQNIEVIYQPANSDEQLLLAATDLGRLPRWGQFVLFPLIKDDSVALSDGKFWVQFDVTELDYYIGMVTAKFERACPGPQS